MARLRLIGGAWRSRLLESRLLEAQVLKARGNADAAVELLRQGLAERIALNGPDDHETGVFQNNLGVALFGLGLGDEAREAFRAAAAIWRKTGLEETPDALNTLNNWGAMELAGGRAGEAEPLLRQALALRRRLYGPSAATAALTTELNEDTVPCRSGWICEVVCRMVPVSEINLVVCGNTR